MSRIIRPVLFTTTGTAEPQGATPDIEEVSPAADFRPMHTGSSRMPEIEERMREHEAAVTPRPKGKTSSAPGSVPDSGGETSGKSTPDSGLELSPEQSHPSKLGQQEDPAPAVKVKTPVLQPSKPGNPTPPAKA